VNASLDASLDALVARCQRGDRGAFGRLVTETQGKVYNLAFGILQDHEEAQDMVQEAYVRAWRALPGFRGDAQFTTWLYRITVNTCLNRKRQLRAQLHVVDGEDTLQDLDSGEPDALSATVDKETRQALWAAVEQLADKYRLVITLFYQEQLSYQQIAELLSLPLGTVKAHLNRAREALAKRLRSAAERGAEPP
jgi:RNA polymerase sigma-70 factor (ECF subfamily)